MIVKENIEIGGKTFTKQYSDGGFYIARGGEKYSETKTALRLLYDSLNQGQQKKLLKNEEVHALLLRYGVIDE